MESEWYYVRNGAQTGPVTFDELKAAAASGQLAHTDLIWKEGMPDWVAAQTLAGLFGTTPSAPPPTRSSAPPLSLPAEVEPESLPLDDEPHPTASVGDVFSVAKVFLSRVTTTSPAAIVPTPHEEECLTQAGILDPLSRRYALWRRAVLWVSVVPTAFAALFGLINLLAMSSADSEALSGFGILILYIEAFSLFALPVCAILAANVYDRLSASTRLVVLGTIISLGIPIIVAFIPAHLMISIPVDSHTTVREMEAARMGAGVVFGIRFYLILLPSVLSLLPAISRACIRVKTFLPQSLVPGWGVVASVPLVVLLTLATVVMLYHFVGNVLLILGLLLFVGAPLLYLTKYSLLTRPITDKRDMVSLANTQVRVLLILTAGVILLIIYLFTAKMGPMALIGTEKSTSLLRPWSLEIHKKWIEYVGRALFLTVLFADVLMRMALSVWREERAFAATPAVAEFDKSMTALGEAVESKRGS
jgi:hypothetical protein